MDFSEFDKNKKKKKKKPTSKPKTEMVTDSFGNKVEKGSATDPEVMAIRAAAKAKREVKAAATFPSFDVSDVSDTVASASLAPASTFEVLLQKEEDGVKLTAKEKKQLNIYKQATPDPSLAPAIDSLRAFSLSVAGGYSSETSKLLSTTDVIVDNFSINAPAKPLLSNATLKLAKGRRYGLLGPNGSGKSTLLKFLAQKPCQLPVPNNMSVLLVEQESEACDKPVVDQVLAADTTRTRLLSEETELFAIVEGQDSAESSDVAWNAAMGRLVEVVEELGAIKADTAEARVRSILTGLGFTSTMQAGGTTTLSGGWRMRVALAQALFLQPALLLLDEPTNHLDLSAVLWLDEHLAEHFKGTLLCVSHDADFLDSTCTDLIHLSDRQLTYHSADVYRFFAGQRGREGKRAAAYKLQEETVKSFCKTLSKKQAVKRTLAKLGQEQLLDKPQEYKVQFAFQDPDDTMPTVAVLDAGFAYAPSPPLFQDLRFSVGTTTRVAIVGANGAGKTTLLRMLNGQLAPTTGEVSLHRNLRVGRYDQHFEELLSEEQTPVAFLRGCYDVDEQEARRYLGRFGLDGARHLIKIADLSGGQKARVVFASLALQRPHVLMLDEPTNHLDMESVEALIDGVKAFQGGLVMVSHDARLISETECDLWVCEGGEMVADGRSKTGIRVENEGFDKFRDDVLTAISRLAARESAAAEARAAQRKKAKATRLAASVAARAKVKKLLLIR